MSIRLSFDRISPFTREKEVMVEYDPVMNDYMIMCLGSGYYTFERAWKVNDELASFEFDDDAYLASFKRHAEGNLWLPFMAVANNVALIPRKAGEDDVMWIVVEMGTSPENTIEGVEIAVKSEDGSFTSKKPNLDTAIEFPNFLEAYDYFKKQTA